MTDAGDPEDAGAPMPGGECVVPRCVQLPFSTSSAGRRALVLYQSIPGIPNEVLSAQAFRAPACADALAARPIVRATLAFYPAPSATPTVVSADAGASDDAGGETGGRDAQVGEVDGEAIDGDGGQS